MGKCIRILGCIAMMGSVLFAQAKTRSENSVRRPFSNVAVGVNVGTVGVGASVATPLCNYVSMRAGFSTLPISYNYTCENFMLNFSEIPDYVEYFPDISVDLKAKLKMNTGHLLFDLVPFRHGNSSFFIAAGLYFGSGKLLTVSGQFDPKTIATLREAGLSPEDLSIDVGDTQVRMDPDGSVSADLKVRSVRPYVGLGFGRAIPKRRVGFRFELGALFHGKPKIVSDNVTNLDSDNGELSDVNKFLKNFKVYPQLNFQVTVRLLKNK